MIERNDDLPPSYEVATGRIKQEDEQIKIPPPPPNYQIITTNDTRLRVLETDEVLPQPLPRIIRSAETPELSCTSCTMIILVIAACLTVFILGLRKEK